RYIPTSTPRINDADLGPPAPDLANVHFGRRGTNGIPFGFGDNASVAMLKPPAPTHPLRISHWSEGNLIYRVQPVYPALARQARVQGAVQLRAIISKTGTIERLTVEIGYP